MALISFFCPRWGSEALPWAEFMNKVKQEGYDGVELAIPGHITAEELRRIWGLAEERELAIIAQHYDTSSRVFAEHYDTYARWLGKVVGFTPLRINSQTGRDFFSFEENLALIRLAGTYENEYGIPVVHETHRSKFSFAAHITQQYLKEQAALKLTLDVSHWVCVSETYLEEQPEAMELAISRTEHIHARVGHTQGPQISDPRVPEWKPAMDAHLAWWDKVVEREKERPLTITPEFGPPPYLATLPFTQQPVADQWAVNAYMMRLLKNRYLQLLFFFLLSFPGMAQHLKYVDPMIGTGGHGHTFPGATRPFGMVQLSPSNDAKGWGWCSGYHYSDSVLKGFAHTHLSGTGLAGLGDILLMPTMGKPDTRPGNEKVPGSGYRSRFSHQDEKASPGYYSVLLKDPQVKVELTATQRTGIHRYTFLRAGDANIIIDPAHHILEQLKGTAVEFLSPTLMRGYKHSNGAGGDRKVYFYARFSKPFAAKGITLHDSLAVAGNSAADSTVKAFTRFRVRAGEVISVQVGISFTGYEGARKNLEAETTSFSEARKAAEKDWASRLAKIDVKGGTVRQKRIFYTALYHTMVAPNLISDVDGQYVVEGKTYHSKGRQFSTFSTWDTFRAAHPLLTILEPGITAEIVNSLISRHTDSKVELPIWELTGHDNACMTGYTPVSVIVDAVLKGIPGIDPEAAYAAIRAAAFYEPKTSRYSGGRVLPYLKKYGYVPSNIVQSVSHNMEYAYQDWCIYQLGKTLGKYEDTAYFRERSRSYLHLYRPEKGFMWPKDTAGNWAHVNMNDWGHMQSHYITGNIWGYTSFVPHDLPALITLKGGPENFCAWLDAVVNDTATIGGEQHVDLSGFIGKYGHGDEPSHHFAYLYNYGGQPWKTQQLVRRVMQEMYGDSPEGLVNNEDCGQMSAWYVFSALGFYPLCPGDGEYTTGSPIFDEAVIHLDQGKDFRIVARNNSAAHPYVGSSSLQGNITHRQLMSGGSWECLMHKNAGHGR